MDVADLDLVGENRQTADRVERAAEGAVRVIDLKTGRTPPPQSEAQTNPQLAAYQLAVETGADAAQLSQQLFILAVSLFGRPCSSR